MPACRSCAGRNTRPERRKLRHCSVYTSRVPAEQGLQSEVEGPKFATLDKSPIFICHNRPAVLVPWKEALTSEIDPGATFFVRRLRSVFMFVNPFKGGNRRFGWHFVVVRSLFDSGTLANASFNLARDACQHRSGGGSPRRTNCFAAPRERKFTRVISSSHTGQSRKEFRYGDM